MADIFISYRRDDSPASVRLLHDKLSRAFPDSVVFLDLKRIDAGDKWADTLQHHLDSSDIMLVVIGPGWIDATDSAGARRLHQADDVVRREVAQFLDTDRRVIPVLVDGATLPDAAALPEELARLPGHQAVSLSHLKFDADMQNLIAYLGGWHGIAGFLAWTEARTGLGKKSVVVVLALSIVLLSLMWVNAFDLYGLDTRTTSLIQSIGDALNEVALSDALLIVAIRPEASEQLGLDPKRRKQYAELINIASQQGARSVAFDLTLTKPGPFDEALKRAIHEARARGTQVVFGFDALRDGAEWTLPWLIETGAAVGLTCVGQRLDKASYATLALVAKGRTYGSFPLYAALRPTAIEHLARDSLELTYRDSQGSERWQGFSLMEAIDRNDADCPARSEGSRVARSMIRLSHRERLREPSRRLTLESALAGSPSGTPQFDGKVILVGATHSLDLLQTRMDATASRFGFEFQADAINALLTGNTVRPLGFLPQWLASVILIGLTLLWRLVRFGRQRRWEFLVLPAMSLLVFAASVALYAAFGLLADGLYYLVAPLITWWVFTAMERRSHNAAA